MIIGTKVKILSGIYKGREAVVVAKGNYYDRADYYVEFKVGTKTKKIGYKVKNLSVLYDKEEQFIMKKKNSADVRIDLKELLIKFYANESFWYVACKAGSHYDHDLTLKEAKDQVKALDNNKKYTIGCSVPILTTKVQEIAFEIEKD